MPLVCVTALSSGSLLFVALLLLVWLLGYFLSEFQSVWSISLFLCLVQFLFLVLFFLANFEGLLFVSVLSVRLFLRLSSWSFYCCRHAVGFLSLRLFLGIFVCPFSTQVLLFLVVLFILLLCMASSSVLSVSFTVFVYTFFDIALQLSGLVLSTISYHSFLLMVFFRT